MGSRGILIAIEGIDGGGKTTQARMLSEALSKAGEAVVSSKEPTDGPWGQKIRASAANGRMSLADELNAFVEDRREHIATKIGPALDRGEIVILDRYFYSTVAYQGTRDRTSIDSIESQMKSEFPIPDIVFLLDLPPEIGIGRISEQRGETPNKFERAAALRVARGIFLGLAERDNKVSIIDATPPIDYVFQNIGHRLLDGVLKQKRCAKPWDCDVFYCASRINGECQWAKDYPALSKSE